MEAATRRCDTAETFPSPAAICACPSRRGGTTTLNRRGRLQLRWHRTGSQSVSGYHLDRGNHIFTHSARCDVRAGKTHAAACLPVAAHGGSAAGCLDPPTKSLDLPTCGRDLRLVVEGPHRPC